MAVQVHVRERPPGLHNGWEQHVGRKMADNDASFLPRNTAIVLQAFEEREGAALQKLDDKVSDLVKVVESLATEQRSLTARLAAPSTAMARRQIQLGSGPGWSLSLRWR